MTGMQSELTEEADEFIRRRSKPAATTGRRTRFAKRSRLAACAYVAAGLALFQ